MDSDPRIHFINQLLERFAPLQQWALDNWPDTAHPLERSDFAAVRREILALAHSRPPEPEQGGPQYINENPAPWP